MLNKVTFPMRPVRYLVSKIDVLLFTYKKINIADLIVVAGILLISIWVGFRSYLHFNSPPFEDAAILMRYAQNLAHGYGIVWNVGDKPVDGATDFLYMIFLSGLTKIGININLSTLLLTATTHLATIGLVYFSVRNLWKLNRFWAGMATVIVALGTGWGYINAYFGTTFFAFFATLTWFFAIKYAMQIQKDIYALLFAISGLVTGLVRPEGVLLAVFMLVSIVFYLGFRRATRIILFFFAIFAVFGGVYFVWRWSYFGYPLPNPFYKKGNGKLYFDSLKSSITRVVEWTLPFSLSLVFGLRSRLMLKRTIFLLIPVVGFTLIWVFLSSDQNYLNRFQYPAIPIFAMSWPALIVGLSDEWHIRDLMTHYKREMLFISGMLTLALIVIFLLAWGTKATTLYADGRFELATALSVYASKGYTMAVTEAGILPFYSGWRTVDTWGLNDQWIVHNGVITYQYLDQWKPEIIMLHAFYSPPVLQIIPDRNTASPEWNEMVAVLEQYANSNGYVLAADFGTSPYETHYYYVKPDFPDSQSIVNLIRSARYTWYKDGRLAVNFATSGPSS